MPLAPPCLKCLRVAALLGLLLPLAGPAAAGETIRLRSAEVHGPGDRLDLPERLRLSPADLLEGGPILLKLRAPIDERMRAALSRAGVRLEAALGDRGFLARVGSAGLERTRSVAGVAWAAPYHPGFRISPEIAAVRADDPRERLAVTVQLFSESPVEARVGQLTEQGYEVAGFAAGRSGDPRLAARPAKIVLLVSPSELVELREAVARWPETLWVGRRPAYRLLNDASAWLGQSGLDGDLRTPLYDHGILGEGQVVAVLDTGLDADMCFFREESGTLPPTQQGFGVGSPDPGRRKVLIVDFLNGAENPLDPGDWDTQGHGTHVAGSIAGDNLTNIGVRDGGDGMAPAAKLVIQDGGYGPDDCADLPAIGCPAADLYPFFEQAYLQGARIHSNSYGDRENLTPFDIYSEGSEAADAIMWDHPDYLLVFAAGNNGPGPSTVASPATAKNVVAVGATSHGSASDGLAFFSSQGPAHDGRIKPDVTAPGSVVSSANNDGDVETDNCDRKSSSGTSMACPTVAGLAALVRQYYVDGFYPSGSETPLDGFTPSAALLKATLIASAAPMVGVTPPPSDPQGWGRVTLDDALYFPGDSGRLFVDDDAAGFISPLDPDDVRTLHVLDSTKPLRVVLTWTDFPSNPAASINLVNDLDLELESPGGLIFKGNVFSNGLSVTGGSADDRNNVEVVRIAAPETGDWTVRIRPGAVPQPTQTYALVATGRLRREGIALERVGLTLDDSIGGNADGILDPGEWVDLPLTLLNGGDAPASNVAVDLTSATTEVEVVVGTAALGDLNSGASGLTGASHLRIHLGIDLVCSEPVELELTYRADGFTWTETLSLPTGSEQPIVAEDFETPTAWQHSAGESTGSSGDWVAGDPDGTEFQLEDDATPDPGTDCLFTGVNGGSNGANDVDSGVVVARSGGYDLSGHPEARLTLARLYALLHHGQDSGDFFRLEIREDGVSPDVLLEELDDENSVGLWQRATFRVADFVTPGPDVELKVSAADGPAIGNIVEAGIDDIFFWDPACEVYDPVPNAIDSLRVDHDGTDVTLIWDRPPLDPAHGETANYRVYRAETASAGFSLLDQFGDPSPSLTHVDGGAVAGPSLLFYEIIAENAAGDSDSLP